METVKASGRLYGQRLSVSPVDTIGHLFQKLVIHLWRANTCMWDTRDPVWPPAVDGVL